MRLIIMGCGRVGEQVSRLMADEGHDVTVIDQDEAALARLGPGFKGRKVKGIGFDRKVLLEAGIGQADAFAATSSSDNANIVAARIARNVFHVPKVVARLYDPRRTEIYRRLGLVTISSTTWGAERIREVLTHGQFDPVVTFGNGEVAVLTIEAPPLLAGRTVKDVTAPGEISVIAITREGRAFIPAFGTQIQADDSIHLTVLAGAMERLESWLGLGEGG
ncbi:MAG TPA: TrkA family potassium uptake protein [Anaerolineales bacterium]|nr:TrkA family potassium uptake protein [Anaerolineales bacterium]